MHNAADQSPGDATTPDLRVTFWGTQGSGSSFPSAADRRPLKEMIEAETVKRVLTDLGRFADSSGKISCTIEQILGGPMSRERLMAYSKSFGIPEPRVFGGLTTCVSIQTGDGQEIIFDCGSGFRNCARDLQQRWGDRPDREVHIFGSHSHLDHTEGFDQAAICFDPRNRVKVYGNRQFLHALDANLGIFSHQIAEDRKGLHTPIFFGIMPARFEACEIRDFVTHPPVEQDRLAKSFHDLHELIRIGRTTIRAFELYHPAPCLGYRVEHNGKVFVFCTDHELRRGPEGDDNPRQQASLAAERRLMEMSQNADLLYRDGQYLEIEYRGERGISRSGPTIRVDWGHSCIEDVIAMARACNIPHCLIGHHDPNRDWGERVALDERLSRETANDATRVELSRADMVVDL